jgi:hypothetical protein
MKKNQLLSFVRFLALFFLFLRVDPSYSEDVVIPPTITASASSTSTEPSPPSSNINFVAANWPDQSTALRYDLQRTSYSINPSEVNRMSLIESAENLLNMHCLEISPQKGFEKSDRPLCRALIESTLVLDPVNPAAICARDGMSSSNCFTAYEAVSAKVVSSDSPALKDKDVTGFIAANNPEDSSQLESELYTLTYEYQQKPSKVLKTKILSKFYDAFARYCVQIAYEVDATNIAPTPTATPYGTIKPFESIVSALNTPNSDETKTKNSTHRKLFPQNCFNLQKILFSLFNDSYFFTCIDKGNYSPQCRKAYENQIKGKNIRGNEMGGGLGKF